MLSQDEIDCFAPDDIKRVDPDGCGCTDCLTGYSRPFNALSDEQLIGLVRGLYQDATGHGKSAIADEARERSLVEELA